MSLSDKRKPPTKKRRSGTKHRTVLMADNSTDLNLDPDKTFVWRDHVNYHKKVDNSDFSQRQSVAEVNLTPQKGSRVFRMPSDDDTVEDSTTDVITAPVGPPKEQHDDPVRQPTEYEIEAQRTTAWLESMSITPSLWDEPEPLPEVEPEAGKGGTKAKRKHQPGDEPLLTFMGKRDEFLTEFHRLDGLGDLEDSPECLRCHQLLLSPGVVIHRCKDCDPRASWCESCVVEEHRRLYLHRIERWNGTHFDRTSLKALGLRIQLGHPLGVKCPLPRKAFNDDFFIIDSDGLHSVGLDYCDCHRGLSKVQQLLRARLFPSTTVDPRTACTFRVLETFQMLSFTGKISGYEFLCAILRRTDNTWNIHQAKSDLTGSTPFKDRNSEWMRMVHEFRHIRMMKRAGRAYDPTGVQGTKMGELAILCPACPQPGINMPKDWKRIPRAKRWLFALFIAMDANFRLSRKDVSTDARDPGLNQGYAYIVCDTLFKEHLEKFTKKISPEKSDCSNHDAIKSANIRGGRGIAASGLGAVTCSCHDMRRPVSAGDLQKGERFVNMDYFLLMGLFAVLIPTILIISYDIACQWDRNLPKRCGIYDAEGFMNVFSPGHTYECTFLVPKFHLPAHVGDCQITRSFNLTPKVGRTDGEAPERGWAYSDRLSTSTCEMGPGRRRDVLDDNFGYQNQVKKVEMASTLASRGEKALIMSNAQGDAFKEFAGGIPLKTRAAWTEQILDFEATSEGRNPYENEQAVLTTKDVKKTLQAEDDADSSKKLMGIVQANVSQSSFVLQGLEIEESQNRLAYDNAELGTHSFDIDRSRVVERGIALRTRINSWITIQNLFAPQVNILRQQLGKEDNTAVMPWSIHLLLPSDDATTGCYSRRLVRIEYKYRIAQAETALKNLREYLIYRAHMIRSKDLYSHGTEQITRSTAVVNSLYDRVDREANRYRAIRGRLQKLWERLDDGSDMSDLEGDRWDQVLLPLSDDDLKGPTALDGIGTGEGYASLKWIWTVAGTGRNMSDVAATALRLEFLRSRARAQRWQEECLLLAAEMRRVERFFAWEVEQWQEKAELMTATLDALESSQPMEGQAKWQLVESKKALRGKVAYAHRQKDIRQTLLNKAKATHSGWIAKLEAVEIIECNK